MASNPVIMARHNRSAQATPWAWALNFAGGPALRVRREQDFDFGVKEVNNQVAARDTMSAYAN
jgi:hypothetical protein